MALNIETFKTRTLTAIVFAAVMLGGIFLNGYLFLGLCFVIMLGCFVEYLKLNKLINNEKATYYIAFGILYIAIPLFFLARLGYSTIIQNTEGKFLTASFTYSPLIPAVIIFSIWINDTMAYMVGSFIGKTPFSKISPKKTWEGTIGGAILCVVAMMFIVKILPGHEKLSMLNWGIIAALCAVFGTVGDLFESLLKRKAGVKDSGTIMPGHGGFLDRFDSLLFAVPAVWLYLRFFI